MAAQSQSAVPAQAGPMKRWAMICLDCYLRWVRFRSDDDPEGPCPFCGSRAVQAKMR